jgi:hypothetical protein
MEEIIKIIPILSLIISLMTFIYVIVAPPKIKVFIEPKIEVFFSTYNERNYCINFQLPITFCNTSKQSGVIKSMEINLYNFNRNDTPIFSSEAEAFYKIENNTWIKDTVIHPILVKGNESTTKLVKFYKSYENCEMPIIKGTYFLELIYKLANDKKKEAIVTFEINEHDEFYFNEQFDKKQYSALPIRTKAHNTRS